MHLKYVAFMKLFKYYNNDLYFIYINIIFIYNIFDKLHSNKNHIFSTIIY